ncbi:MAG: hypothetical protein KBT30_00600 [Clostridiales bacterium]|nr:hypothetical protein [Candidatus Apopatousia equi]
MYVKETKEEKIAKNMRLLGLTYEEAKKVVEDDEIIDKGGKCEWEVELTPEQKKAQRQARLADRKVSNRKIPHKRTENQDKRDLIQTLKNGVETLDMVDNIVVSHIEREITFNYKGVDYKVVLSAPRTTTKE